VSAERGAVGDTITVTPAANAQADWGLVLEYVGGATTSPRGISRASGAAYRFDYERLELAADWNVRFFTWSDSTDVRTSPAAFAAVTRGSPIATRDVPRLDYFWYRPTVAGLPQEKWAAVATSTDTIPPGDYSLRAISDDAVRVWIDGRLAIDDRTPHESAIDYAPIARGRHDIRVEYYQVGGWTELRLDLVRGTGGGNGSPGPH
jgi:hypothetical protein